MQIFVKCGEKVITAEIESLGLKEGGDEKRRLDYLSTTVASLKEQIQDKEGIPPSQQKLVYAGKELQDERGCLDYGMGPEDTVHLTLCLSGGE